MVTSEMASSALADPFCFLGQVPRNVKLNFPQDPRHQPRLVLEVRRSGAQRRDGHRTTALPRPLLLL